ncbi:hypothetical protein GE107_08585 [Cohnella sp. CFH 77786]|uniref:acetamidase/formamidase family protein n=1 Tax=Cohnella sp. CFH 77786 TaxID=2662265 RepID=UPI001C6099DA|nr:hypothetical protein [Cohnella sp. CFH 77786]
MNAETIQCLPVRLGKRYGGGILLGSIAVGCIQSPVFMPGRHEPRFTKYLTFKGFSFRDDEQYYLDTTFAIRDAVLDEIRLFGPSGIFLWKFSIRSFT